MSTNFSPHVAPSNHRPPRQPRERLSRVTRRSPCLVCGKSDKACLYRPDGTAALCSQRASDKPGRGGCLPVWWHFFGEGVTPAPRASLSVEAQPEPFRAPVEHVDGVLTALLRTHLSLSPAHAQTLGARGLSAEEIAARGYASAPDRRRGDEIAAALADYDLRGVPGFWRDGRRWRMKGCPRGFFVQVRDERSRVVGLQIRCDDPQAGKYLWFSSANMTGGTGSGAPVHFARPHLLPAAAELLVTEGSLKANVIASFLGVPVVAAAGVGNFGADFAARLRALCPHVTPIICFDSDWMVKPQVEAALKKLKRELRGAGFNVKTRTWPSRYKGLDDYLLACHLSRGERRAA